MEYIYLLKNKELNIYKIGRSNNIKNRMKNYSILYEICYIKCVYNSIVVESNIINEYNKKFKKIVNNEFFKIININDAIEIIDKCVSNELNIIKDFIENNEKYNKVCDRLKFELNISKEIKKNVITKNNIVNFKINIKYYKIILKWSKIHIINQKKKIKEFNYLNEIENKNVNINLIFNWIQNNFVITNNKKDRIIMSDCKNKYIIDTKTEVSSKWFNKQMSFNKFNIYKSNGIRYYTGLKCKEPLF